MEHPAASPLIVKGTKMKLSVIYPLSLLFAGLNLFGQTATKDTIHYVSPRIVVTANRLPVMLKNNPGAVSIVMPHELKLMPKSIGAEEALRLVPGVRIDNQHDGERVHVSIRGQGILTERGLRGIGVIVDGVPLNDPSGFVPDLYDVDWATVQSIQVLRGPSAGLYGGGGAAGVIQIQTANGGLKPFGSRFSVTSGSNGFTKALAQVNGLKGATDYRVSFSRTRGDGYRDHQAFWGNKLYEKINFTPAPRVSLTQILSRTDYFQQNPEGLNIGQFDNFRQANPDARPFNEYQKTGRTTFGLHGTVRINSRQDVTLTSYLRSWRYKETSNKCAEYRTVSNPGASLQYNLHLNAGAVKHTFSLGSDLKSQSITMVKLESAADPDRKESLDETNIETENLLANQLIDQKSAGMFALYTMRAGGFSLMGNLRYDAMGNTLTDKMVGPDTSETSKDFSKISGRLGASYAFSDMITLFGNWSQGFLPPSTEELAANPVGYSGFNTHLVPATSNCLEFGVRGFWHDRIHYELTGFYMTTGNDFFRFKQSGRGNQEVFYGNAGNSERYGFESYLSLQLRKHLNMHLAYTYAHFEYTSGSVDPVYADTSYVLTVPPAPGQWLPNSPRHQLYSEIEYTTPRGVSLSLAGELQSKWAIYTDASAYSGLLDPAIYRNWQEGFFLLSARVSWPWRMGQFRGECSISARNILNKDYMAFTEPDPDGNAYHPGPAREMFGSVSLHL